MMTVTVSSRYQVTIPKPIRKDLHIRPGQKMLVVTDGKSITFVPDRPIREYLGVFKGMDTSNIREKQDRPL